MTGERCRASLGWGGRGRPPLRMTSRSDTDFDPGNFSFDFGAHDEVVDECCRTKLAASADQVGADEPADEAVEGFRAPGEAANTGELLKFLIDRTGYIKQLEEESPARRSTTRFKPTGRFWTTHGPHFCGGTASLVGISIDGPREMHDAYRVDKGGEPTFDKVMGAIEPLRRARRRVQPADDAAPRQTRPAGSKCTASCGRVRWSVPAVHSDHRALYRRGRGVVELARPSALPAARRKRDRTLGDRRAVRTLLRRGFRGVGAA